MAECGMERGVSGKGTECVVLSKMRGERVGS